GTHTPPAIARDTSNNTTPTSITVIVDNASGGLTVEDVIWTSPVYVTPNGSSLTKTSGCDGCADAGAISQQTIASVDGYVEFTASETNTQRHIGLSNGNPGTSQGEIKFALQMYAGYGTVFES